MVRIAKIKYSSKSKLYDYLCEDTSINVDDVVYVEGQDRPFFVYEIGEVKDSECKATKRVLSLAEENPNVTLSNRYMNIVDCKCCCIVNSLGPKTNVFGAICNTIVEKAKSKEIEEMLDNHPTANVFDTFVTDAGNLPSDHIIHIVMPFKKDDRYNANLRLAFEKVIDIALDNGYDTLAIPFIGTGANGYNKADVLDSLNDTMFKYQYKKDISINLVSISFNSSSIQKRNQYIETDCSDMLCYNYLSETEESIFDVNDDPTYQISNLYNLISKKYKVEDEFDLDLVQKPIDFLVQYRKEKGKRNTIGVEGVFGFYDKDDGTKKKYKDVVTNIQKGKRTLHKEEVYRIAIELKLNFTEIIQFMNVSNFSFSALSVDNMDFILFDYMLKNNGFSNADTDPRQYIYENCTKRVANMLVGDDDLCFSK